MRWCTNCGKVNTGWPARCHHCAAGLDGRLCTRGHVNPIDPGLAFCGDCGQPLERKCGAGFSAKPYLLAAGILACAVFFGSLVVLVFGEEVRPMSLVIAMVLLVVGVRFAFQILPPSWARNFVRDAASLLLRFLFGTGNKG